ncbi:MAG: hypothetical protein HYU86_04215 [Chloroflexi bacterium]|nr:hypothetical protein [Chloroflexota bacterium]
MFDDLKMFVRYVGGLGRFLSRPQTLEESRRRIEHHMRTREESFLRILERGVFSNPKSPYRRLFTHAGIELGDVARGVRHEGVEETLEKLYHQGVYITLDEFKGRRPIQRPGLEFPVSPSDFDNPLSALDYETQTGGSRGTGTRIIIDFDLLAHEAAYLHLFLTAFDLMGRPVGFWGPIPPAAAPMKNILRSAKVGVSPERWFTQNRWTLRLDRWKPFLFTAYAVYGSRLLGKPLPIPESMPLERASLVARWLAAKKEDGMPALFYTNPSSGVRICLAAKETGLDIGGTFFRFSAEPYTSAKARLVSEAGCNTASFYGMAEIGNIGLPCAAPSALDDVHLAIDKLAVIQRNTPVGESELSVGALFYTTLLPSCPKLMINVGSGDYGILEDRRCGCLLEEMGFHQHLHDIRSYDKLTSEGMTFLGSELISLVEDVLPARFGGSPTDYQFIEEEEAGLTKVSIVVSPRVGEVDEGQLITTVLSVLGSFPGSKKMMAERWREAATPRVIRREPYATRAAKILPLHIL